MTDKIVCMQDEMGAAIPVDGNRKQQRQRHRAAREVIITPAVSFGPLIGQR